MTDSISKDSSKFSKDLSKDFADCISRQAVFKAFKEICIRCGKDKKNNGIMCGSCLLDDAIDIVEELPSVEHEIIRCKDCKFYIDHRCYEPHSMVGDWRGGNHYCSLAERRTDG